MESPNSVILYCTVMYSLKQLKSTICIPKKKTFCLVFIFDWLKRIMKNDQNSWNLRRILSIEIFWRYAIWIPTIIWFLEEHFRLSRCNLWEKNRNIRLLGHSISTMRMTLSFKRNKTDLIPGFLVEKRCLWHRHKQRGIDGILYGKTTV